MQNENLTREPILSRWRLGLRFLARDGERFLSFRAFDSERSLTFDSERSRTFDSERSRRPSRDGDR